MSTKRDEKRARELLPLLIDGELSEHEEALVRRVMEHDPALKREGEDYIALKRLTSHIPRAAAPENLEEAVSDRLSEKSGVRSFLTSLFTPPRRLPLEALGVAAACVLVLFAVVRLVPFSDMKPTEGSPMVESTESYDTGGRGTMTLSAGEDDTPAVPNTVPHTSVDTAPAGPSPEKALPPFTDADLLAEEEAIREEPEDEVIAGIMTPAAEERLTDSGDAATLGGAAPGMTATAPAAMTEGDAVNRGTSATILLVSTSSGTEHPIILTIYTTNPYETERAIMDKAMELGGDVKRMRYSESGEMLSRETEESSEFVEGNLPPTVYLPPEGVEDLLMFIESQYPPIGPELEELDMTDKRELLQLDFIAPDGGH